jgi:hypothetical protein
MEARSNRDRSLAEGAFAMERDEIIWEVHVTFSERKRLVDECSGPVKKQQNSSQCNRLKSPIGTTIPPAEANFLSEEDQCAKAADKMHSGSQKEGKTLFNSPTNCASIGGCRPTKDRAVCS